MPTKATQITKQRVLTYLDKDYDDFKNDIVESHLRVYYPNQFQDFSSSNIGMMFVELMAFVADNLSFYLDRKFSESFTASANELQNIFKHAQQLGFKAYGKTSAFGEVNLMIAVPAIQINNQWLPDMRYAGVIAAGCQVKNTSGQTFETLEDADFSTIDPTDTANVAVAKIDPTTKLPQTFGLNLAGIPVKAGQTKSCTFTIGAYTPFLQLTIPDADVLEVLSVTDSNGNVWYEVDYLAQDSVFDSLPNTGADSTEVPFVLKLRTVPYRFVTQFNVTNSQTSLIFGSGDASSSDYDLIPNLGDLSIPAYGKKTFTDFSIDPQNFLRTRTLGLAPINTVLTVQYRVGGGSATNAGANTITTVSNSTFEVGNSTLDQSVIRSVGNTLAVINPYPAQGGRDMPTAAELKQLIPANFASQSRAVTVPDYVARTLSMPSKFGAVFRAFPQAGQVNTNSVELAILAKDQNGNVATASPTLKTNLQTYLSKFRMMTDAVELLDGNILNVGISFSILCEANYNRTTVLTDCLTNLQNYFDIDLWQIGQPINLTDLEYLLADVDGVLSVYNVQVTNLAGYLNGRTYSNSTFNIAKNTQNNIIYCPANSIFSVQYPTKDIIGMAK